jgi:hypothetical protein
MVSQTFGNDFGRLAGVCSTQVAGGKSRYMNATRSLFDAPAVLFGYAPGLLVLLSYAVSLGVFGPRLHWVW